MKKLTIVITLFFVLLYGASFSFLIYRSCKPHVIYSTIIVHDTTVKRDTIIFEPVYDHSEIK